MASHLLEHLIDDAKHRQYRTIVAGIDASNEASIKLHENSILNMLVRLKT